MEELREAPQAIPVIDVGEGDMVVIEVDSPLSVSARQRVDSVLEDLRDKGFKGIFLILDSGFKITGVIRNKK